jgi:hypothetical protein
MDEVLRDAREEGHKSASPLTIDGHRNLYAVTAAPGAKLTPFDSGINRIAPVKAPEGRRVPAIIIASSPHKVGKLETPWQDIFDVDNGHIRYYGDNKTSGRDPAGCKGNKALLEAFDDHDEVSREARRRAIPLVFFRRTRVGFVRFEGFGLVTRAERVVQRGEVSALSFSNYAFDFAVMDLGAENEVFPWSWINLRRDPTATLDQTLEAAPESWRIWVKGGATALEQVRRRVARRFVHSKQDQLPARGSPEEAVLADIYQKFHGRKVEFEGVAAWVAERVLKRSGDYRHFGVTKASADGGFDFVGRLDIGEGFGQAKIVVLGQAKCESRKTPTNGLDVARTVARLRRGWIGVYVTTSFFSDKTQQEVLQDRYPILLINGRTLAEEVRTAIIERGGDLSGLLAEIESTYADLVDMSDPDQVLFQA